MSREGLLDVSKADYVTIVKIGSLYDLQKKMKLEKQDVFDIVNLIDEKGMSLTEHSIVSRNFSVSKFLLDNGAMVNIVSKDGFNEFHYIAANINCDGAIEIAYELLKKGTSIMQKDGRYGNTALFTLCIEAFKVRSKNVMEFIEECLNNAINIDEENFAGISIRKLIQERGNEKMKKILSDKYE